MEINSFLHPSFEGGGNFLHGVDHDGDLGIQSFGKESSYSGGVACLGLSHQVLEFEEICLETIILSSGSLFQGFEFILSCFIHVERIEHVSECLFYDVKVFICWLDVFVCEDMCYNFFPFPCLFPHLSSTMPILLLCSFL